MATGKKKPKKGDHACGTCHMVMATEEERLSHALHVVKTFGADVATAAMLFDIPVATLKRALKEKK